MWTQGFVLTPDREDGRLAALRPGGAGARSAAELEAIAVRSRCILSFLVVAGSLLVATSCSNGNLSPIAQFTTSSTVGSLPLTVAFDASASYDPDGTIVQYAWEYGDGAYGRTVTSTHTYTATGGYVVTLEVTDNEGQTGTAMRQITGVIGGPCEYVATPGTARVVQIVDAPSDEYNCHDAVSIVFDFQPADPSAPGRYLQPTWPDSGNHLMVGGGANPPRQWAIDQRIVVGAEFACIREDETTYGPCTPVVFTFPTIDYSGWAEDCFGG
jgi:hypothetical protein